MTVLSGRLGRLGPSRRALLDRILTKQREVCPRALLHHPKVESGVPGQNYRCESACGGASPARVQGHEDTRRAVFRESWRLRDLCELERTPTNGRELEHGRTETRLL